MKRAVELFSMAPLPSPSPLVETAWEARSVPAAAFLSVATTRWKMVVTRQRGAARMTVRGPETAATAVPVPQEAEFLGIEFSAGTFLRDLAPGRLVDRDLTLPRLSDRAFRLDGSVWELPGPGTADAFVERLVRSGLLVHDPVVPEALAGEVAGLSTRSVERRVARATGLSRGAIARIRRAEQAVDLLSQGVPAAAVAGRAGYADQPHLHRSLRRYVGQTPAEIVAGVQDTGGTRA